MTLSYATDPRALTPPAHAHAGKILALGTDDNPTISLIIVLRILIWSRSWHIIVFAPILWFPSMVSWLILQFFHLYLGSTI